MHRVSALLVRLAFAFGPVVPLAAAEFPGTLVLGRPTDKLIAANVVAPSALSFYLEYGTRPGVYGSQSTPVDLAANQPREIELRGLAAGTRHYYRMRFKTAAAAGYDAGS